MKAQAGRYKPSVNIERAPRGYVPLIYIGAGWLFLVLAAGVMIRQAHAVAYADFGDPWVVVVVHLVTLGFLSMTAMGVLNQWVPVVFDVPAMGPRRGLLYFGLYTVGVAGFVGGFGYRLWPLVAVSGAWLAGAIVLWSATILGQLVRSPKPRDVVHRGLQLAIAGFNVTWGLGLFMALSFIGWWPEYQVLRAHLATALVAWLGCLILTVQLKLNPMFALSKIDGLRPGIPLGLAGAGVVLAWVSAFTPVWVFRWAALCWIVAALWTMAQSVYLVRRGKSARTDRLFIGVAAAWLLLLGAAVLAFWLSPLAVLLAFWGMTALVLSYQTRILPFLVALTVARRLPAPPGKAFFLAQAMHSISQPAIVGALALVGAWASVAGIVGHRPDFEVVAGLGVILLVVSQAATVGLAMRRGGQRPAAGG